ncbi:TPA: type VI secretion system amidase effector protein Tae4 [Serratia marcescens]|nr:type VI secretion system amidase effector protein Tae4 [Serratia marcescens]
MNNNRPIFSAAWAASTKIYNAQYSAQNVAKIIGGRVTMNIAPNGKWENTCAVRMSYILNKSGFPIPYVKDQTVSGADRQWYFFRVKDLIAYLTKIWGKPDLRVKFPPPGGGELAGKKGIILFEIAGWSDAGGHATLWNGNGDCYDHCYFNEPEARYTTNYANFWVLR